jgi:hypothetical protein
MKTVLHYGMRIALVAGLTAAGGPSWAAMEPDTADTATIRRRLAEMYHEVLTRGGLSVGGEFRSEMARSGISGSAALDTVPSVEGISYTSVDFDLRARPHDAAQGRAVLRLHSDWRNLWTAPRASIFSRWLSIDGNVGKGIFRYNVGDFKQRYTPLTLHAPQIDLLYEPAVFALDRHMAMDEEFVSDNERLMQGINLRFDARVTVGDESRPLLDGLHLGGFVTRLRHRAMRESKMILPIEAAQRTTYAGGGDGEITFMRGLTLGGTYLGLRDVDNSFVPPESSKVQQDKLYDTLASLDLARWRLIGGRAGVTMSALMDAKRWRGYVDAEFAHARSDDEPEIDSLVPTVSLLPVDTLYVNDLREFEREGSAMRIALGGGIDPTSALSIDGEVAYIRNEPSFENPFAQSPTFTPARIMNVANDPEWNTGGTALTSQYSAFDALYRHVFRFVPEHNSTHLMMKRPYTKNAYSQAIYTPYELERIRDKGLDPSLQMVMPLGPATPNRAGIEWDLTASLLDELLEIKALGSALSEMETLQGGRVSAIDTTVGGADTTLFDTLATDLATRDFSTVGGGVKMRFDRLLALEYPLRLQGSVVRSGARYASTPDSALAYTDITSDLINVGLYYRFVKRWALLGGYQRIADTYDAGSDALQSFSRIQQHAGGGVQFIIDDGAYLVAKGERVWVESPELTDADFAQSLWYLGIRVRM